MKRKGIKARGNGQGCAIKVGLNNWKAIAVVGWTDDGNPVKRTKQGFYCKADALAYIQTLKQEKPKNESVSLKAAFDGAIASSTACEKSLENYNTVFKAFRNIWYIDINNIGIDDLQGIVDGIQTKSCQRVARCVISMAYKWAIPRHYVADGINKAEYIKCNGADGIEKHGFTVAELELIRQNIGTVPHLELIYCHCYLGFRPSELLELTVNDYDKENKCFIGGLKTDAGRNRTVTVSPKIQSIIDGLVSSVEGKEKDNYIFSMRKGKQTHIKTYRAMFYEALGQIGIETQAEDGRYIITPHCCRRTFATLLKAAQGDLPEKDVLELMGHTDMNMTRYYQDVNVEDLRKLTDRI